MAQVTAEASTVRFILRTEQNKAAAVDHIRNISLETVQCVVIEEYEEAMTAQMRNYWHLLMEILSQATGIPPGAIKTSVKVAVLGLAETPDADGRLYLVMPSSERQTRKTYGKLIDWTIEHALEKYGAELPPPRWTE